MGVVTEAGLKHRKGRDILQALCTDLRPSLATIASALWRPPVQDTPTHPRPHLAGPLNLRAHWEHGERAQPGSLLLAALPVWGNPDTPSPLGAWARALLKPIAALIAPTRIRKKSLALTQCDLTWFIDSVVSSSQRTFAEKLAILEKMEKIHRRLWAHHSLKHMVCPPYAPQPSIDFECARVHRLVKDAAEEAQSKVMATWD